MGRSREAVDAAMFAAAIRIDRLFERDVGRRVARDDAARSIVEHLGSERWRRQIAVPPAIVPAVIDEHARVGFVAARRVRERAAALEAPRVGCEIEHRGHDSEANRTMRTKQVQSNEMKSKTTGT